MAVELGADLIGLNFWPRSPRFVQTQEARSIIDAVEGRALTVGVWVDPTRQQVAEVDEILSLDLHQFHGDAAPTAFQWFPNRVIRAIRLGAPDEPIRLEGFDRVWGLLFDCAPADLHGGTGESWSYERIAGLETSKPVLLAGGLGPENVGAAITASRADIVDVCSGVEAAPGIKDPDLLKRFLREVRNVQRRD